MRSRDKEALTLKTQKSLDLLGLLTIASGRRGKAIHQITRSGGHGVKNLEILLISWSPAKLAAAVCARANYMRSRDKEALT